MLEAKTITLFIEKMKTNSIICWKTKKLTFIQFVNKIIFK